MRISRPSAFNIGVLSSATAYLFVSKELALLLFWLSSLVVIDRPTISDVLRLGACLFLLCIGAFYAHFSAFIIAVPALLFWLLRFTRVHLWRNSDVVAAIVICVFSQWLLPEPSQVFLMFLGLCVLCAPNRRQSARFLVLSVFIFFFIDSDLILISIFGYLVWRLISNIHIPLSYLVGLAIFPFFLAVMYWENFYSSLMFFGTAFPAEATRVFSNILVIECMSSGSLFYLPGEDSCLRFIEEMPLEDQTKTDNFVTHQQAGSGLFFRLLGVIGPIGGLLLLSRLHYVKGPALPIFAILIIFVLQGTLRDVFTYMILLGCLQNVRIHRNL